MTSNYCGIDFGTSNCTAGWLAKGVPYLAQLEGESPYLSSALYIKQTTTEHDDDDQAKIQSVSQLLRQGAAVQFGQSAHQHYSADPVGGVFIRSPKSMLGSRLTPAQSQIYTQVSSLLLQTLQQRVATHRPLEYLVLGRPVHFQGIDGAVGDDRAEAILRSAAKAIGVKELHFAYEPVAAAVEYERQLTTEKIVLVVDIGGGTSDISMIRLGPQLSHKVDRSADLLAHAGRRIGGVDMDIKLAIYSLMPLLGRGSLALNGKPLPAALFSDAVNIIDIQAQETFYKDSAVTAIMALREQAAAPALLDRLLHLQQQHLSYYLVQQAEQGKIQLAKSPACRIALHRLEQELCVHIDQAALDHAIYVELNGISKLVQHCLQQAQVAPDQIYLTGGASAAQGVQRILRQLLPDTPIIAGDRFGSVGKGLCTIAAHYFA